MKELLEPIPTEQITIVQKKVPRADIRTQGSEPHTNGVSSQMAALEKYPSSQLDKAYPWLLGASACLSGLLCWMYVTKPVIINQSKPSQPIVASPVERDLVRDEKEGDLSSSKDVDGPADQSDREPALIPAEDALPGNTSKSIAQNVAEGSHGTTSQANVSPANSGGFLSHHASGKTGSAFNTGWESTNLKVQHILSADSGNGELEKIVLNVPVLYETRTMRWTSADTAKARDVLARLMLYERNLNILRKEGQGILKDWNGLLEKTVPLSALRADSPSIPYNPGQGGNSSLLPGSSKVITVEPQP